MQIGENGLWFVDVEGLHHKVAVKQITAPSNTVMRVHHHQCGSVYSHTIKAVHSKIFLSSVLLVIFAKRPPVSYAF